MRAVTLVTSLLTLLCPVVSASETHRVHPATDVPAHEQFYSTWYMPDQPARSCCNKADCYPTTVEYRDGHWYARRREDGRMLMVPWPKFEVYRDSPDGRSHLCAPPPSALKAETEPVFCFKLGGAS